MTMLYNSYEDWLIKALYAAGRSTGPFLANDTQFDGTANSGSIYALNVRTHLVATTTYRYSQFTVKSFVPYPQYSSSTVGGSFYGATTAQLASEVRMIPLGVNDVTTDYSVPLTTSSSLSGSMTSVNNDANGKYSIAYSMTNNSSATITIDRLAYVFVPWLSDQSGQSLTYAWAEVPKCAQLIAIETLTTPVEIESGATKIIQVEYSY